MCSTVLEGLETRRVKDLFEILVNQASICNGGLAFKRLELLLFSAVAGSFDLVFQQLVYQGVYAADEETGNRSNMADVFAFGVTILQSREVGINYLAVGFNRKDQRNIDVDAFGQRLSNSWEPFGCSWNLDKQVGTINQLPEATHFRKRPLGIVCQVGRDFEADIAVLPIRRVVDWAQYVGNCTNVLNDQRLVNLACALPFLDKLGHLLIIGIAMAD